MNKIQKINGYDCRKCDECKLVLNVNSMVPNADICIPCVEWTTEIKIYEVTEGDFNDVYNREIVHGTGKQIEEYVKSFFKSTKNLDSLASDGIGFGILNSSGQYSYYVEAIEIENVYNESINVDLVKE